MNSKIHSFPLPEDCNPICRVPWGHELPWCLYRSILGAGTEQNQGMPEQAIPARPWSGLDFSNPRKRG